MRDRRGRMLWWVVGVLALGAAGVGTARADMIYFKNGTTMWGEEAVDEEDQVLLTRGGQTLKFPKSDVDRIEQKRTNMPDYNVDVPPPPAVAGPPGAAPAAGPPGGPQGTPPASPPAAFNPPAPGGPQGAIPMPGSSAPQGMIPIPGAGAGIPPQPSYGPPGGGPPAGAPPGAPPR